MTEQEAAGKDFLNELYRQTDGNLDLQVSMYEIGAALGLEKSSAGGLAEELIYQGLIELRTLSGGISLCPEALEFLGLKGSGGPEQQEHVLSRASVADSDDIAIVNKLMSAAKHTLPGSSLPYEQLEEAMIDLKCVELQLLSSAPKTAIIRELLRSLHAIIEKTGDRELADRFALQL